MALLWADAAPLLAAVAADADKTGLARRQAALLTLVGIVMVGIALAAAILLGGHWVRKLGNPRRGPVVPPDREPIRRENPKGPQQGGNEAEQTRPEDAGDDDACNAP